MGSSLHPSATETSLGQEIDRKSTRLNSSHSQISYAVFCLKKKKEEPDRLLADLASLTCREAIDLPTRYHPVLGFRPQKQHDQCRCLAPCEPGQYYPSRLLP